MAVSGGNERIMFRLPAGNANVKSGGKSGNVPDNLEISERFQHPETTIGKSRNHMKSLPYPYENKGRFRFPVFCPPYGGWGYLSSPPPYTGKSSRPLAWQTMFDYV